MLVMIFPDIAPPSPEILVEFVLWIWWCVTLGLLVNASVQLLLSPGDPLMLLRRELDTRLQTVAQLLRRLATNDAAERATTDSLNSLDRRHVPASSALKNLLLLSTHGRAPATRNCPHSLRCSIGSLPLRRRYKRSPPERLSELNASGCSNAAEGCERMRRAFAEMRLPAPGEWTALASEQASGGLSPLADIERTLDQIALAVP